MIRSRTYCAVCCYLPPVLISAEYCSSMLRHQQRRREVVYVHVEEELVHVTSDEYFWPGFFLEPVLVSFRRVPESIRI